MGRDRGKDKDGDEKEIELQPPEIMSLLTLARPGNFFANTTQRFWKLKVGTCLATTPKLSQHETYYQYFNRHSELIQKFDGLLAETNPAPAGGEIFALLYQVVRKGLDKLFAVILDKYPGFDVNVYCNTQRPNYTLAHVAAISNNAFILEQLIAKGINLNVRANGFSIVGEYCWIL